MTVTVVKKLNPYFEIIGLLYDSVRPESAEEEAWKKSARNRGLNPEELNRKIGIPCCFSKIQDRQGDGRL